MKNICNGNEYKSDVGVYTTAQLIIILTKEIDARRDHTAGKVYLDHEFVLFLFIFKLCINFKIVTIRMTCA